MGTPTSARTAERVLGVQPQRPALEEYADLIHDQQQELTELRDDLAEIRITTTGIKTHHELRQKKVKQRHTQIMQTVTELQRARVSGHIELVPDIDPPNSEQVNAEFREILEDEQLQTVLDDVEIRAAEMGRTIRSLRNGATNRTALTLSVLAILISLATFVINALASPIIG
jgi:chromosome segregation ATPase